MVFRGSDGIVTRIVCGYNSCKTDPKATRSSYQQHRRYLIKKEKDTTCPRTRFKSDLFQQLEKWREEGDRLIVCMDANEDIYKKSIGKTLTKEDGLGMKEVVGDFTGKKLGATFFVEPSLLMASGQPRNCSGRSVHHASGLWSWRSSPFHC